MNLISDYLKSIQIDTGLAVGLLLFEDLPSKLVLLCIVCNLLYFISVQSFPIINLFSPAFILSFGKILIYYTKQIAEIGNYYVFFSSSSLYFSQLLGVSAFFNSLLRVQYSKNFCFLVISIFEFLIFNESLRNKKQFCKTCIRNTYKKVAIINLFINIRME